MSQPPERQPGDMEDVLEELAERMRAAKAALGPRVAAGYFRKELVERIGLQAAFTAVRAQADVPGIECLVPRNIASLQQAAAAGDAYRQLWEGGERFTNYPPRVIGGGDHGVQHGVSRTAYLGRLDDVMIRGRSPLVLTAGEALLDYEQDEPFRFADTPEVDPGVLYAEERRLWTMEAKQCDVIDEAFMLSGHCTHDFGHWLTDHLPKLGIALLAGLPNVPVLVDERIPETHFESVRLALPDATLIKVPNWAPLRVRKLWVASHPRYRGYYPLDWTEAWSGMLPHPGNFATAMKAVIDRLRPVLDVNSEFERVYLARRRKRKKLLVNHRAIEDIARSRNFRVLYPEDLSFADQIRLVHHARHIIAPDGSNGLLGYFVSPGARICFLNHEHTYPLVELNGMFAEFGGELTILAGRKVGPELDEPFWSDYEIDVGQFSDFLDEWLDASRSVGSPEGPQGDRGLAGHGLWNRLRRALPANRGSWTL